MLLVKFFAITEFMIKNIPWQSRVEITVVRWLKPTESQELPIIKVSENPILTDRSIVLYRWYED